MSKGFLERSFHIKWSELTSDRIKSDIQRAVQDSQSNLDALLLDSEGVPTYKNTLLAFEASTEALSEGWGKVSHLVSVCDTEDLRKAYGQMLPVVTEFFAKIPLNEGLWKRLRAFSETPEARTLSAIQKRLLEETLEDFRQQGAGLAMEKKARLEAIQSELSSLTRKYSENVLDSTNQWELVLESEADLKGLPENAREIARQSAMSNGQGTDEDPRWRFSLQAPSMEPFMTFLEKDSLRRQMWEAGQNIGQNGDYDNTDLIRKILELRTEKAALLGRKNFPELVLYRRMAGNGATALEFVEDLHKKSYPTFVSEQKALEQFKMGKNEVPDSVSDARLEPWEMSFCAEQLRQSSYQFDSEDLRPYFPLDQVQDGMFELVRRIFGIRVREVDRVLYVDPENPPQSMDSEAIQVWHPEVRFFEIRTDDDSAVHLGSFYTDWHPRETKRSGAWMNHLITGGPDEEGRRQPHLGLICGNLTPGVGGKPAQLTHREVETVFHEFGHLLHHLLGEVPVKSLNGVQVAWDFVELPSQIMENWCWERESLNLFARHHETGEPIPDELYQKMIAARNFRSASAMMRQLCFGKLDLEMHLHPDEYISGDMDEKLRAVLNDYLSDTLTPQPMIIRRFHHIFGDPVGYAAGYYSYKWAEVLDADAFSRFKKEGLFNRETGREFVECILSKGNSENPMDLFKSFMGREPNQEALLERSGIH